MKRKLNILVIEEHCLHKKDMESIFPHSFRVVRSPKKAIQAVTNSKSRTDIIILDEDIQDVIQLLSNLKHITSKPVYLMASRPDIKQKALECHVDGFIHEPFDIQSFNKVINQHEV